MSPNFSLLFDGRKEMSPNFSLLFDGRKEVSPNFSLLFDGRKEMSPIYSSKFSLPQIFFYPKFAFVPKFSFAFNTNNIPSSDSPKNPISGVPHRCTPALHTCTLYETCIQTGDSKDSADRPPAISSPVYDPDRVPAPLITVPAYMDASGSRIIPEREHTPQSSRGT